MLKINRKVEYALMTLKFMTCKKDGELTSAREICEMFKTPFDTTAKVMQSLNNNGILTSIQGVKGGYTLSKDLKKISYIDLTSIIEGKAVALGCDNNPKCNRRKSCNISAPIKKLNKKLTAYLNKISLDELLSGNL